MKRERVKEIEGKMEKEREEKLKEREIERENKKNEIGRKLEGN